MAMSQIGIKVILLYLNAVFFLVRHFKAEQASQASSSSYRAWLDISKRYKSQTQANIRRSAWITIPIAMSHASFASLVLFAPRNPQALRWKPGDWHDAKKKKHKDPNKYGEIQYFQYFFLQYSDRIKVFREYKLGNINWIQSSLISRYHMNFNQALVTVKKNSLELKNIWENNFNYIKYLR